VGAYRFKRALILWQEALNAAQQRSAGASITSSSSGTHSAFTQVMTSLRLLGADAPAELLRFRWCVALFEHVLGKMAIAFQSAVAGKVSKGEPHRVLRAMVG
jgi:hypothetical protein